ncbi:hypothetical protein GCM10010174_61540 [Kutzneria viridogrisea]|uniref:Capsid maturation protease n=1 Tax=Kutzneria viridogrisea TaxID=47990 RepID=A0ABR6BGB7_9PSEU|nr:hypothetical protein [Kutzneria viridogrisea]
MSTPDYTEAIAAQYIASQAAIRARLLAWLAHLWASLTAYRDADAAAFVRTVLPMVTGAQRATATLAQAHLTRLDAARTGAPLRIPSNPPDAFTGSAVRNADPVTVYTRPFVQVRTALSQGRSLDAAAQAGGRRLQVIAATDVQLAKTHASRATVSEMDGVTAYRRVLVGTASCGLCIVASTQRYHKGQLMDIHPGCDCEVEPIHGTEDPGQIIDAESLAGAHAAIRERFGTVNWGAREIGDELRSDGEPLLYKDVLISHEHGEIGPVIAVRGQHFTGPSDIP